ncbi:Hypothetical predicted protein [Olea europaea subsp. europaea]|uniref:Uncharacterized protein n=1 Tax=Olea europaea subsp. europaea TaxID=158383 RepID=A0A8S0SYG0_OLEEU|nr:Hypothetical predicted protein [Olea europaea subsp. europaea]
MEPYPDEQDMRADTVTGHLQDGVYIAGYSDNDQDPMPAATDDLLDGGPIEPQLGVLDLNVMYDSYSSDRRAMQPSQVAPINDAEFKGCIVTDGDGKLVAFVISGYFMMRTSYNETALHTAATSGSFYYDSIYEGAKRTKKYM